jgi:Tfp pilus assembly protein PilX
MTTKSNKQRGAVSLFVVIFAALLITIVTVSFVRIMIQDQQQASTTDLSQSAYDSAQAGVEDAKRALLRLQSICSDVNNPDCAPTRTKINSPICNFAVKTLDDVQAAAAKSKNGEVNVQTGSTNNELDQAYTCVKIITKTDDYIGNLGQNASKFIPLVGVSSFDTIKIEWFSTKDLQASTNSANIPAFVSGASAALLSTTGWATLPGLNRPPIMRAQLIQFNNTGFSLSDFEGAPGSKGSNNTLFLYPSNIVETTKSFASDIRQTPVNTTVPTQVHCNDLKGAQDFACSATITLPAPVAGGTDHTQYLNLTSLYKNANYRVTLWNGNGPTATRVQFDGVQPEIDSTGRTNDLFRRVQTRVELTDVNFPYPDAEIDISGSFCKNFRITDNTADWSAANTISGTTVIGCTP